MRQAPRAVAASTPAANQLVVPGGNACGPTSLLNSFRFGNRDWQNLATTFPGKNDRERIQFIIRQTGNCPSKQLPTRSRWTRSGVSVADLTDMANDLTAGKFLPLLSNEIFILKPFEKPGALLTRVHHSLESSLARGFPPVLSLRRYVLRTLPGKAPEWTVLDAHFVTVLSVPLRLEMNAISFPIRYIDPWGGKALNGQISIPSQPALTTTAGHASCLEAQFPGSSVGKKRVHPGEQTLLTISAAIGR